jgi:hypothetical protein
MMTMVPPCMSVHGFRCMEFISFNQQVGESESIYFDNDERSEV